MAPVVREVPPSVRRTAQRLPRIGRGGVHRGRGHGAIRPESDGPFGGGDALAVQRQVGHQLQRRRAPERPCRTVHRDRPEDPDADFDFHST